MKRPGPIKKKHLRINEVSKYNQFRVLLKVVPFSFSLSCLACISISKQKVGHSSHIDRAQGINHIQ